jgi:hypothetical protein
VKGHATVTQLSGAGNDRKQEIHDDRRHVTRQATKRNLDKAKVLYQIRPTITGTTRAQYLPGRQLPPVAEELGIRPYLNGARHRYALRIFAIDCPTNGSHSQQGAYGSEA